MADLRDAINDREHTVVYLEVPNALYTVQQDGIWDITYEHCSYYTPTSLTYLLNACGFDILDIREVYDGQFLSVEARLAADQQAPQPLTGDGLATLSADIAAFGARYRSKVLKWRQKLAHMTEQQQTVIAWGGGSKGVTFLNVLAEAGEVGWMVDINPRKQGKYVAGTGQTIMSPTKLATIQPDEVIVMNAVYVDEIREMAKAQGVEPAFRVV